MSVVTEWALVVLTFGLVIATFVYAWATIKLANQQKALLDFEAVKWKTERRPEMPSGWHCP